MRPFLFLAGLNLLAMPAFGVDLQADRVHHDVAVPRLVAQVLGGTSGIEPGIAAEWRFNDERLVVRPEVFLSEDARVGAGASVAWSLAFLRLPERQDLTLGPRVVYHNSDESRWEADAQAIYSVDICPSPRGRHYIEVIGAIGILEDTDGDDETVLGANIGVAYGFQF